MCVRWSVEKHPLWLSLVVPVRLMQNGRITRLLVWTDLSNVVISFRHTKFRTGYLWGVGSGQKMVLSKTSRWIWTPSRWWSSYFRSWLGLCFLHLDQLSQVYHGLRCFLSANCKSQWRVGSLPSVVFFLNNHICEFFGCFPPPLHRIICAQSCTFIAEYPFCFSMTSSTVVQCHHSMFLLF